MTQEDRNIAFLHMQHTSNGPSKAKNQVLGAQTNQQDMVLAQPQTSRVTLQGLGQQALPDNPVVENRQDMPQLLHQSSQEGRPTNIPSHMLMQRQNSALDTLAEVSRRHMDYSTITNSFSGSMEDPVTSKQTQDSTTASMLQNASMTGMLQGMKTARQTDSRLEVMHDYLLAALQRYDHNDHIVPRSTGPNPMPVYPAYIDQAQAGAEQRAFPDDTVQSPLVHTAATASHQMNQSNLRRAGAQIDPQLDIPVSNVELIPPDQSSAPQPQPRDDFITWTEAPQGFVTQQEPPSNEPNPEFGTAHKSDKNNARARFTDTRRKEVQEVRKRGACMRCRMLKKPCSEGTPCGTCKKIDSARLWKGTCLRTKLADEFTLYSASYFHSRMVAKITPAVFGLLVVPLSGSVQVRFVLQSTFTVSLSAKRHYSRSINHDVDDNGYAKALSDSITPQDFVLLDDTFASQKVSNYCKNDEILQHCIDNEKSTFLKATLQEAVALLHTEKSQEQSSNVRSGSRTNHISPSVLLSNVMELWASTNILIHEQQGALQIRYNANVSPSHDPQNVEWTDDHNHERRPLSPDSLDYGLILHQILAATETACHRLSRAVMNELERRLLQRQQVSGFATFISAVILLSCIERITSFYHSMDPSSPPSTANENGTGSTHQPGVDLRPPGYPSTVPAPSTLWPQGTHFARLLTTLLRMRALPPRITLTMDNKLAALREPGLPVRLNGVAVRDQQGAETARAANWLDPLKLDVDFLRARRDSDVDDVGWDMKFVSAVLLGEGM